MGEAHPLEEGDVVGVLVVAVAGHLGVGPLRDVARLPVVPRPRVPDAGRLAALVVTTFDLLLGSVQTFSITLYKFVQPNGPCFACINLERRRGR